MNTTIDRFPELASCQHHKFASLCPEGHCLVRDAMETLTRSGELADFRDENKDLVMENEVLEKEIEELESKFEAYRVEHPSAV